MGMLSFMRFWIRDLNWPQSSLTLNVAESWMKESRASTSFSLILVYWAFLKLKAFLGGNFLWKGRSDDSMKMASWSDTPGATLAVLIRVLLFVRKLF